MNDDNIFDISNRLPPIEVRKSWRQKLPSYYADKIDALKDGHKSLCNIISLLSSIRGDFPDNDAPGHFSIGDAEYAAKYIDDTIVLLRCAEEKLHYSIPSEEFMTPEDLKEFGRG